MWRRRVLDKALRRQVVVCFLTADLASFVGRLAEYDDKTFVLEACETIPNHQDAIAQPIRGRQYIDRVHAFLQELPS